MCLPSYVQCDLVDDCGDGSDEMNCTYCETTESVLTYLSPDVSVYPNSLHPAPLQGGGEATVDVGSTIGFTIEGTSVIVFSVRIWVKYATKLYVKLYTAKGITPPVQVGN